MKIITANVNGIRAAARKGFFDWVDKQQADVVCIQETKAQIHQLDDSVYHPADYYCYYHDAEKKGYSGVALYCRQEPDEVIVGMGKEEFDTEGRYIEAKFANLSVISLYMPSGSSKEERQLVKYRCMDHMMAKLEEMKRSGRDYIICGDWNIAHKNEDIRNWKGNQKNSGFLPEERAWLDVLFDEMEFVDAFRELEQEEHQYTWWSNRGQAWANNVGWRIDYQVLTPNLKGKVISTEIYKEQRFSDHAPLLINYNYDMTTE
ncbi:MAG: exodeoxyribonuclease III [Gammaproteobacteria bacterium]|nr:MAG: exodeoxyribonuclease III [Gammaproteobacteria bacterium]